MSGPWRTLAGTRRGGLHVHRGLPNQDAHLTHGWADGGALVVVADGHGDPRHSRSQTGSRLAVEAARTAVDAHRDALAAADDAGADAVRTVLEGEVGPALVGSWQAAVDADLAERADERTPTGELADRFDYGTTVLLAVSLGAHVAALQLGDGEVVLVSPEGVGTRPMPLDPLLDGTLTTSLCQDDPLASVRYAVVPAAEVGLAWVCTDGFGVGRVDGADWWRPVGEQLWGYVEQHGVDWVAERLDGWLVEPADVGGDDVTLAVLVRPEQRSGSGADPQPPVRTA